MARNRRKNRDQFAVLGLGKFGSELCKALYAAGKDVLAVDIDEERVQEILPYVTHAVTADATDENALKTVEITSFDAVAVAIGDVQASTLATMILKDMGVEHVIVKAYNELHKKVLERLGAEYVLIPEADMAARVANRLINTRLGELMEINANYSIVEADVPLSWAGKTLKELDVRRNYNVNVILVLAGENEVLSSPGGDTTVAEGSRLVVGGANDDIARFIDGLDKTS